MAEERVNVATKGVYYAPVGTALPTISKTLAKSDWVSAGWAEVDYVNDDGVEWEWDAKSKPMKKCGALMPWRKVLLERGVKSITFASDYDDEAAVSLAISDATATSGGMSGGGDEQYYAMALHSDTSVMLARKVSATGKLKKKYDNDNWTGTPYEFECFEDDTEGVGTCNWDRKTIS